MSEPENVIFLVCEGSSDPRVVQGFTEQVLLKEIDWWEHMPLEAKPVWKGMGQHPYLAWRDVPETYKKSGLPPAHGHFNGLPAEPDAVAARKALRLAYQANARAVVLFRDEDNQPTRRDGLVQARDEHTDHTNQHVLIGVAKRCREAWVLIGFRTGSGQEQQLLQELHQELAFDPTQQPERLNGKNDHRDPKRVLDRLLCGNVYREEPCWLEADLNDLKTRGQNCGLTEYLNEVETILVPLLK
ncbi:hypothetical protein [Deinococcus misasensis]|uniref:hypothetical protein n=1 Tax=Deinococcus misasensis TaxID=392413 RepID=UPI000551F298|nr:hypothetical protein [Deinococcus misasensis]